MPLPAMLLAALPYLGAAATGAAVGGGLAARGQRRANPVQNQAGYSTNAIAPGWDAQSGAYLQPGGTPERSFWKGTPEHSMYFPKYVPEQGQAFQSILREALSSLGKNKFDFGPIEQQARQGFAQQTLPSISERFTSLGAQKSSAFPQLLNEAGTNLETNLAAMKSNYGLEQQANLLRMLAFGLSPQFESTFSPRSPGFPEQLLLGLAKGIPSAMASYYGQ